MTEAEVKLTKIAASEMVHRVGLETIMDLIRTCVKKNALHVLPALAEEHYTKIKSELETITVDTVTYMESKTPQDR